MRFTEVETLFHEFGHALQGMLTTVEETGVSGVAGIEWDAVEVPSQFMENWCYHKPTLVGMTAHVDTGEALPEDLFEKIAAARTFRAASSMMRQLELAFTDLELHHRHDPQRGASPFAVHRAVAGKTSVLEPLAGDRFLCAFSHIFAGSYAAGYYSYKWAEVFSADAFAAFEEEGLDNEGAVGKTGRRFRDTFLAMGGSEDPMEVFRRFRGREPRPEALLRQYGLR
jgi:oligopeptidase A